MLSRCCCARWTPSLQAQSLGLKVAVASSGSPEKIAHNLGSSGLAPLFPDPYLVGCGLLDRLADGLHALCAPAA